MVSVIDFCIPLIETPVFLKSSPNLCSINIMPSYLLMLSYCSTSHLPSHLLLLLLLFFLLLSLSSIFFLSFHGFSETYSWVSTTLIQIWKGKKIVMFLFLHKCRSTIIMYNLMVQIVRSRLVVLSRRALTLTLEKIRKAGLTLDTTE